MWGGVVFQDLHISIIRVSKQHQIVWLSNNKYLLDKAETNIQNYHACEIDSGGPAGLFWDAGFATFCDGITRNWVLKFRETGLNTPTVPGMS